MKNGRLRAPSGPEQATLRRVRPMFIKLAAKARGEFFRENRTKTCCLRECVRYSNFLALSTAAWSCCSPALACFWRKRETAYCACVGLTQAMPTSVCR